MINKRTTLVLGAGASKDFQENFPTGLELMRDIVIYLDNLNKNEKDILTILCIISDRYSENVNNVEISKELYDLYLNKINQFKEALNPPPTSSIDDFLKYRSEYTFIGKLCISIVILKQEFNRPWEPKNFFYQYLWTKMIEGINPTKVLKDEIIQNNKNLTIVSFNYDRSLENYFYRVGIRLGLTEEESLNLVDKLNIYHVYGFLGDLKTVKYGNDRELFNNELIKYIEYCINNISSHYVSYFTLNDRILEKLKYILNVASNIKTIGETIQSQPYQEWKNLFYNSEIVYFLGYGFVSENMNLFESEKKLKAEIYSTVYGLRRAEIEEIRNKINRLLESPIVNSGGVIHEQNADFVILDYINQYKRLE